MLSGRENTDGQDKRGVSYSKHTMTVAIVVLTPFICIGIWGVLFAQQARFLAGCGAVSKSALAVFIGYVTKFVFRGRAQAALVAIYAGVGLATAVAFWIMLFRGLAIESWPRLITAVVSFLFLVPTLLHSVILAVRPQPRPADRSVLG